MSRLREGFDCRSSAALVESALPKFLKKLFARLQPFCYKRGLQLKI